MKTAIILNGFVRTWDRVINNFMETFAYMEPYVFVTTYNKQYGYHPHIKNLFKIEEDHYLSDEQIEKLFYPVHPRLTIVEDADELDKAIALEQSNMHPSMREHVNCYGQFRKLLLASRNLQMYERVNEVVFDRIIKTRSDILYHDVINFDIRSNQVLIDSGNVFPNDCFFMTNRDAFFNVCNSCFNQFYEPLPTSHEAPPHRLLQNAFEGAGLEIVSRKVMKSVMRATGEQFY